MVSLAEVPLVLASRTILRISRAVCSRNPVVLVNIQLGQGADINLKLALLRKRIA